MALGAFLIVVGILFVVLAVRLYLLWWRRPTEPPGFDVSPTKPPDDQRHP
jgi:hypothetical protein